VTTTAVAAGNPGRLPNLFTGWDRRNFLEIQADENAHVAILTKLADNPRPKPTFVNLMQRTPVAFARMAAALENGGVGAYLGGVEAISSGGRDEYLPTAAGILAVEARHTGFLNTLLNQPIAPGDRVLDVATDQAAVRAAVAPFIASFNGGPPMAFDPHGDSDENDQAIVNFALVLEFLEAEFYNLNVRHFFR
jgi:hypothetical protein